MPSFVLRNNRGGEAADARAMGADNSSRAGKRAHRCRRLRLRALIVSGLLMGACAAESSRPLPGPSVVDVKMTEYRFDFDKTKLKAGRVLFKARNSGKLRHQIVLVTLPPEVPPIVEQLNSPERRGVNQVASFPPKPPGARAAFAIDLKPARYAMICFVLDPDDKQHGAKGMATEFVIK